MHCERGFILLGLALVVGLSYLGLVSEAQALVVNENTKFAATGGAAGDRFGYSVAFDGTRPIVGSRYDDAEKGSAYVFQSDGGSGYIQLKKLVPGDAFAGDQVGSSVVISGDLALVGGYKADVTVGEIDLYTDAGAVWVFKKDEGGTDNWGQFAKLLPDTPVAGATFGSAIALDGNTLLVGAQNEDTGPIINGGAVYVFEGDGAGNFTQVQKIVPTVDTTYRYFGQSLDLDGDTMVVGSYGRNKAYVFEKDAGTWVEQMSLTVTGTTYFGTGTSIQDDTIVVGAYQTDIEGQNKAGSAYVFNRDEGGEDNWGQVAELLPGDGPQAAGYFGISTAIDGDKIVVGARGQDGQGAAYGYGKTGGVWVESGKLAVSDGLPGDELGFRVALVGDLAVVTAQGADAGAYTGAAYTFTVPDPSVLIPGNTDDDDDVDADDAAVLAGNWGSYNEDFTYHDGDFNGDHYVNALDASILAGNWTGPGESGASSVPEPNVMILLAGIILPAFLRRGRRG